MRAIGISMGGLAMVTAMLFLLPTVLSPVTGQDDEEIPDVTTFGVLWEAKDGHNGTLWSIRWSPDGSMISASFWDNMTIIYDAKDGKVIARLGIWGEGGGGSRTGSRCDGEKDNTIDTRDYWPTRSTAWSPDGQYLVITNDNGEVYVYRTEDWSLDDVLVGHNSGVLSSAFSHDGKWLATGSGIEKVGGHPVCSGALADNRVIIWDWGTRTKKVELTSALSDAVMSLAWSPDDGTLAVACDDGFLTLWNTTTWDRVGLLEGHTYGVLDVDWSPDGKKLVTGSRDYTMRIWDAEKGELIETIDDANCVRSVDWHKLDGLILESGVQETLMKVRDSNTGAIIQTFEESASSNGVVMSARWSPDGKTFAAGSGKERTVRLYGPGGVQGGGSTGDEGLDPNVASVLFIGVAVVLVVVLFIPLYNRLRRAGG